MRLLAWAVAVLAVAACRSRQEAALPRLEIDPARITVSGLSAGAYMAHQVHLALSDRLAGAALVAPGPYGCAAGDLDRALKACMNAPAPDVAALAAEVRARAADGRLAPLAGLAGDRVLVVHGTRDAVVSAEMSGAVPALYAALDAGTVVTTDFAREMAHLFPTQAKGVDCAQGGAPHLGNCGFDAAGAMFAALYDTTGSAPAAPAGRLVAFSQGSYAPADADAQLADNGFAYIPPQCGQGRCGLHIAFHGCQQSSGQVGETLARDAGYNRWADAASVVVVYPQVEASMMPLNPKACWDWWGYTGANYDTRSGAQLRFVSNLLDALAAR